MNKGYSWGHKPFPFGGVWKREAGDILHRGHPRSGFECVACGRVFHRKHVRYSNGLGWICRDRCERIHKGLP